ncbi:THAP domain-containing protein 11 [Trichechus manatus latirostris]|uniref:THAP domain-containing protein 11 n=1 Tax=Trichechus manatus latirostris TaxID=127582 RepID=A0A2Y9DCG6_TRIMA|nr:THAP domain-containing protein 11 [Trichechus manatus latirostris]
MPGFTCCVPGCYNNSHRDKALHFYTFPKDAELRRLWLKNVSRAGVSGCFSTFQPTTGHRLCSVHFQGGRKTYTVRVPTIFPLRGVNERKVARRPAGAAAARRRQQQQQQQQQPQPQPPPPPPSPSPSASTAQTAQLQPNLVSASAAVLLTLQAAVDSSQAPGSVPPAPTTPTGEDVKPIDLTVQVEFAAAEGAAAAASELEAATAGLEAAECPMGPQLVVVGEEGFPDSGSDHSYSLSSGTTEEELLRKLNEQRDILALMEVKMKEMKGSIRHLRLTEAKLREELREKDRLLAMAVIRKKHGM